MLAQRLSIEGIPAPGKASISRSFTRSQASLWDEGSRYGSIKKQNKGISQNQFRLSKREKVKIQLKTSISLQQCCYQKLIPNPSL